jgi:hypothetical protein
MIQRIQSIWLFLAVVTLICLFFLPLLTKTVEGGEYNVYTSGVHHEIDASTGSQYSVSSVSWAAILPVALNLIAALLSFAAIFFFKNRTLQKRLIGLVIFLIIVMTGCSAFNIQLLPGGAAGAAIKVGTFLPLLAIIFSALALRGIRKDEQLLRSADRLR